MCTKSGFVNIMKENGIENTINSISCLDCEISNSSKYMNTYELKCGLCCDKFRTICTLHNHLLLQHKTVGSYIYEFSLHTAFPKLETKCISTQTAPYYDSSTFCERDAVVECEQDNLKGNNDKESSLEDKNNTENYGNELTNLSDITDDYYDDKTQNEDPNAAKLKHEERHYVKEGAESNQRLRKRKKTKATTFINENLKKQDTSKAKNETVYQDKLNSVKATVVKKSSCFICKAKFTTKYALLKHESKKHSDQHTLSCDLCNKRFIRQVDFDKHKIYGHSPLVKLKKDSNAIKTSGQTKCQLKSDSATSPEAKVTKSKNSDSGVNTSPSLKTPYTCELCGHVMPRSKIDVHQRLHTGERPFTCSVCGKGLISAAKLKRHMLVHEVVKKHTCELCGAGFNMKYKLAMHMHIHTGKKPYLCSICGAEFNHSSNLATHTRCVHLQVKPFKCKMCGGEYAKRSQLEEHLLRHSSEKLHTCRFCGKSFKHLKGMKRHEKNHLEEKNCLKCDICDAKFVRKDTLDRHKLIHDKSSVRCPTCKTTFPDQEAFETHRCIEKKKDEIKCLICDLAFKTENKYLTHMLAIHNLNNELAKKMNSEWKTGKTSKKIEDLLLKHSEKIDPNLPLQSEDKQSSSKSQPVKPSFNVNTVVSSILEENNISIHAMTRVATENLRLHSQDIRDDEKAMIHPPVNPLTLFEKNSHLSPLDSTGSGISFSAHGATNSHMSGNLYSQHLSTVASARSNIVQNNNVITNQFHAVPFVDQQVYGNNSSLINISPFVGRSTANLLQMPHIASPSVEEGTMESLRRLQETSDPPMSVAMVMTSRSQGQASLLGDVQNHGDGPGAANAYHIQHLY